MTNNNGKISGTPTTAGTFTVQISVTDSVGDVGTVSAPLVIIPAPVNLGVSSSLPSGTVGQSYSGSIAGTKGTGPYTITVTGLPAGLTNSNGNIDGTPTAAGSYAVQISVADSLGNTGTSNATIAIAAAPVVPPPVTPPTTPPVASCTAPAGSKSAPGVQANVTTVLGSTVTIGKTVVTVPSCAAISWQGNWSGLTKAIRVGYNVQVSKGYVLNGVTFATSLIVDNGL